MSTCWEIAPISLTMQDHEIQMIWRGYAQKLQVVPSIPQDEHCCCDKFSTHNQRCTREENWIFRSSIKSYFQRIKNHQFLRSVQGVMIKSFNVVRSKITQNVVPE